MRGRVAVLAMLTIAPGVANSAEEPPAEQLPLGFLEFLGGMVEVESEEGPQLVDPLDFEALTESPAEQDWDEPATDQPQHLEERLP